MSVTESNHRYCSYGEPESVLEKSEVVIPPLADGEILVKVMAAGVSPIDFKTLKGFMQATVKKELPAVLGTDVAGTVAAVGSNCSRLQVGDEVFADLTPRSVSFW